MKDLTLSEQKRMWEGLRLHPAWEALMEMALAQEDNRRVAVMDPMRPGQEYEREFLKGEVSGIQTFRLLVDTAIEMLEVEIQRLNEEPSDAKQV